MGKFGAFVIGALIPTAVAVHCYREGREARAQYVQVQSSYAQHMRTEGEFLRNLQANLKPAQDSVTGLTRTVLELSADCDSGDAIPTTLELVKQYRGANQEIRALINGQLATVAQYGVGKSPVRANGEGRRELEQQLAALTSE